MYSSSHWASSTYTFYSASVVFYVELLGFLHRIYSIIQREFDHFYTAWLGHPAPRQSQRPQIVFPSVR